MDAQQKLEAWFKATAPTLIIRLIAFLLMLYIFMWGKEKYGMDRTLIVLLIIIILNVNDLAGELKKWNSQNPR